eukprot:7101902-Pyramimonas_sp.AAC.1
MLLFLTCELSNYKSRTTPLLPILLEPSCLLLPDVETSQCFTHRNCNPTITNCDRGRVSLPTNTTQIVVPFRYSAVRRRETAVCPPAAVRGRAALGTQMRLYPPPDPPLGPRTAPPPALGTPPPCSWWTSPANRELPRCRRVPPAPPQALGSNTGSITPDQQWVSTDQHRISTVSTLDQHAVPRRQLLPL